MKWNKKLPVAGFAVEARFVDEALPSATHKGEFICENMPEPLIIVRKGMSEDFTDLVVLHEWAHAWLYQTDLGQLLGMDSAAEEVFCTALAASLKPLIADAIAANPKGKKGE